MKFLLVDNHNAFQESLAFLLRKLNLQIEVISASDYQHGLQLLAQHEIDLVLLDFSSLGTSGRDTIETFKQQHPDTPVVLVAGKEDWETILQAVKIYATAITPKTRSGNLLPRMLSLLLLRKGIYLPRTFGIEETLAHSQRRKNQMTAPKYPGLTPRQSEILALIMQGQSNKTIARNLGITEHTVHAHLSTVFRSLKVSTRAQAIVAANKIELIL